MKFIKILLLSSVGCLLTVSCAFNKNGGSGNGQTIDPSSYSDPHVSTEYVDESNYQYSNVLDKPNYLIHNMEELSSVVDYHAFYKDVNSFVVTLSDYQYSTKKKTVASEINYLYWFGELVNGTIGISGEQLNKKQWKIKLTYYHDNYIDSNKTMGLLKDECYTESKDLRSDDYNSFYTEPSEERRTLDVATTQQLWYAAEHGYAVNPIKDSPAEKYYALAKDVLRDIVDDSMDEYEKASAIYNYIDHRATYCYEALAAPDAPDEDNFPDEICSGYKAFYIEGFFDNDSVVCDGFSKVYTLLGSMEGLEIVRAIGTSDKAWTSKRVAGHAYCYIEIDGQYYLSCPTWGQLSTNTNNTMILNKNYFLSPFNYIEPYDSKGWPGIESATSVNNERLFKNAFFEYDGLKYDSYVGSSENLTPYVNKAKGLYTAFLDLLFENQTAIDSFLAYISSASTLKHYQISSNELIVWRT